MIHDKRIDDLIKEKQRDAGHRILGSFIKGVANNVTNIKKVDERFLGENLLGFSEGHKMDVLELDIANYDKFVGTPDTFVSVQSLVKDVQGKIQQFGENSYFHGFSEEQISDGIDKYASKLINAASELAFGEGDTSEDLKTDIRVLLKIGIDEFEKRNKEDEAMKNLENSDSANQLPEDQMAGPEDDMQYQGEEPGGDGGESEYGGYEDQNATDEAPAEDTAEDSGTDEQPAEEGEGDTVEYDSYDQEASDSYGSEEAPAEGEEGGEEEAKGEHTAFINTITGQVEIDSYRAYSEELNYVKLAKSGYDIPGLSKEETKYLASLSNIGPGRAWEFIKRSVKIWSAKLGNTQANRDAGWHAEKDINWLEGFNRISVMGFMKFLKVYILLYVVGATIYYPDFFLLFSLDGFISYHIDKFVIRLVYKENATLQKHIKTIIGINEQLIKQCEYIKKQAVEKGDTSTKERAQKIIDKAKDDNAKLEDKWITYNKYGERADLLKQISSSNELAKYSGDQKYFVRGNLTGISESAVDFILDAMVDLEDASYKALGESTGYEFTPDVVSQHKQTMHTFVTLAVLRHKAGLDRDEFYTN